MNDAAAERLVAAIEEAERLALRDHKNGVCHLLPWSCSHCELMTDSGKQTG